MNGRETSSTPAVGFQKRTCPPHPRDRASRCPSGAKAAATTGISIRTVRASGAAVASSIAYAAAMLVDLVWVVRHSTITPRRLLVAGPDDARLLWTRLRQARGALLAAR